MPPEKFVEQIEEHNPDIVGFSAFLTTTMPMFKANINALEKAGLRDKVIVMVGGAPVTQEYADAVGADGYSADASSAVKKAKELIELPPGAGSGVNAAPVGVARGVEHVVKGPVWGCQMCGQCVLHSTGLTCPMTCPKTLRNGPCGGVRADGHCEVKPEMRCVWLKATSARSGCRCGAATSTTCARRSTTARRDLGVDQPDHRPRPPDPAGWAAGADVDA